MGNDVANRIKCVQIKWQKATGVMRDKKIALKKGKGKTLVRSAVLYRCEYWAINKNEKLK